MISLVSLLVVIVLSMLVVRVATVALTLTGVSRELARFQARSAFTGAGFTTSESEKIVQHPVRRRIVMLLMLLGNAGIVTAASTLMLSFVNVSQATGLTGNVWFRILVLLATLGVLWKVATSRWIDRRLSRWTTWALEKWTKLEARDYAGLLHLTGGYVVVELMVSDGDWVEGRRLDEMRLSDEGILVLGVEKTDGTYVGAPRGQTVPQSGDVLLLYGPQERIERIDVRPAGGAGNWEHYVAVDEQKRLESEQAGSADTEPASQT